MQSYNNIWYTLRQLFFFLIYFKSKVGFFGKIKYEIIVKSEIFVLYIKFYLTS